MKLALLPPPALLALLALALLPACQSTACCEPHTCATRLTETDRAGIAKNSEAWLAAVRARDWAAVAATYVDDAMLLPPNMPAVSGRAAIRGFFEGFPPIVSMDLTDAEVEGCCDVAYVRGNYRMSFAPPGAGGTVQESGKYIEIRWRQADGSWLKKHDMFSSDAPPQ